MSKRMLWGVTVCTMAAGVGVVISAQKVVSLEDFDRAMKTIGSTIESVEQSIASGAYEDAKAPLALARQTLASSRPWWETNDESDAVRMNREAVAALDALDKALSAITVDESSVIAASGAVTRTCDACHAAHREGDEQTGYRIKQGG